MRTHYRIEDNKGHRYFADTLEEAEEIYFDLCNYAEFVRIAYAEDGCIITVRTSW